MKAKRLMTAIGTAVLLAGALAVPGTASARDRDDHWRHEWRHDHGRHFGHFNRFDRRVIVAPVVVPRYVVQPYAVYPPVVYQPYVPYPSGVTITFSSGW